MKTKRTRADLKSVTEIGEKPKRPRGVASSISTLALALQEHLEDTAAEKRRKTYERSGKGR